MIVRSRRSLLLEIAMTARFWKLIAVATHFDTVDVDDCTIVDAHVHARRRWRRRRIEPRVVEPRVVEPRGRPCAAWVDSGVEVAIRLVAPHAARAPTTVRGTTSPPPGAMPEKSVMVVARQRRVMIDDDAFG